VIKVERGEKEGNGEDGMSRRKRRKKSSAYLIFVLFAFALAGYVYYTTHNLFFAFLIVLLGVGIAISSR
jgi:hypothetical protein